VTSRYSLDSDISTQEHWPPSTIDYSDGFRRDFRYTNRRPVHGEREIRRLVDTLSEPGPL